MKMQNTLNENQRDKDIDLFKEPTDMQHAINIAEYNALRSEISNYIQFLQTLETYAVIAVYAFYSFLFTTTKWSADGSKIIFELSAWAWALPAFIPIFCLIHQY